MDTVPDYGAARAAVEHLYADRYGAVPEYELLFSVAPERTVEELCPNPAPEQGYRILGCTARRSSDGVWLTLISGGWPDSVMCDVAAHEHMHVLFQDAAHDDPGLWDTVESRIPGVEPFEITAQKLAKKGCLGL